MTSVYNIFCPFIAFISIFQQKKKNTLKKTGSLNNGSISLTTAIKHGRNFESAYEMPQCTTGTTYHHNPRLNYGCKPRTTYSVLFTISLELQFSKEALLP